MKRCLLLFALYFISILICEPIYAGSISNTQYKHVSTDQTDTVITQLTNLNFAQFNGQPVDSLLAHLPGGYTTMKIGGWRSQRLAEVLYILYPNNVSVGIHVRNFQFMNPHLVNTPNPTENWNITLFKKETITFTIAFNGPNCINGCENVNK